MLCTSCYLHDKLQDCTPAVIAVQSAAFASHLCFLLAVNSTCACFEPTCGCAAVLAVELCTVQCVWGGGQRLVWGRGAIILHAEWAEQPELHSASGTDLPPGSLAGFVPGHW